MLRNWVSRGILIFRQRTSQKWIQCPKNKQVCTVVMFYTCWGTKNLDFKCLGIGYLEEFEIRPKINL